MSGTRVIAVLGAGGAQGGLAARGVNCSGRPGRRSGKGAPSVTELEEVISLLE